MSTRRLVTVSILAATATVTFAALVFAGTLGEVPPAPPAPPALPAPISAVVPPAPPSPATPVVAPALPAPPAPPARHSRHVHVGDLHARFAGETLVVESDGDAWVIEDRATVRRFREAVRAHTEHAREIERLVATMQPAIAAAEAIGKEFETDAAFRELERDIEASVERTVESEVARALAHAEAVGARAEVIMKRHEASLRQMERELAKVETEIEALEKKFDRSGEDVEADLEEILDEAFEKGLAKPIR